MPEPLATADYLSHLLGLLDDDTPQVRESVGAALQVFDGDVSELLHGMGVTLSASERTTLSRLLHPARRERLRRDWVVPTHGAAGLADDWEAGEALLRMLSDYLHDGITLRQPLPDALDMLEEELAPAYERGGEVEFCRELFGPRGLRIHRAGARKFGSLEYLDLAAVIGGARTYAIGACLIALLLANRLGADIQCLSLSGDYFLQTNGFKGGQVIVSPSRSRVILERRHWHDVLLRSKSDHVLGNEELCLVSLGEILIDALSSMQHDFMTRNITEDYDLLDGLVKSLAEPEQAVSYDFPT